VTDVNAHRPDLAADLGFPAMNVAETALADAGLEPDVLLECSRNARATRDAVNTVARAGPGRPGRDGAMRSGCRSATSRTANSRSPAPSGRRTPGRSRSTRPRPGGRPGSDGDRPLRPGGGRDRLSAARRDPTVIKAVVTPTR